MADSVEYAVPVPYRQDFFEHEDEEDEGAQREQRVVDLEEELQLERFPVAHDLAQAKDDGEVAHERADDGGVGGQRGRSRLVVQQPLGHVGVFGQHGEDEVCDRGHNRVGCAPSRTATSERTSGEWGAKRLNLRFHKFSATDLIAAPQAM